MSTTRSIYLHGFSKKEQDRLRQQAAFEERDVFNRIDLYSAKKLIEIGCGVGAQTEILLRRFPQLFIDGIDLNDSQIKAAEEALSKNGLFNGRFQLQQMDATQLEFESETFDAAFLCWTLEHIPDPVRVLGEARRVLKRGGQIWLTETMNSSLFLDPYSPNLWKYWMAFNDYQYASSGDPFVGAKLGNLLTAAGFKEIQTHVMPWHYDNRTPKERKIAIEAWGELILSASNKLLAEKYVDQETVSAMQEELKKVKHDPNAVFFFAFVQATAIA
ncbi:MAG: SAM-dependent methyltransferase [Bdellovibrionales bacterium CG10_big_fil_rev_8_21_14_0_10_45_34]|nr:MAG: SAM-dependent methyltransferase [Bdellovibrionales bacterium CG10_big_fil_rev_8_21_14_0_10_45_34]